MSGKNKKKVTIASDACAVPGPSGGGMSMMDALSGGTMIMKSVSIFLASGRRVSSDRRDRQSDSGEVIKKRGRKKRMDDGTGAGKISAKLMDTLKKKTRFSRQELEVLCRIYRKLVAHNAAARAVTQATSSAAIVNPPIPPEGVDRIIFRELLHSTFDLVTEDTLVERIFCAWERGHSNEGSIRLEGWLTGLSVFLRGTPQEQAEFCFRVYDLNGDGFITRDEMFQLLKNCLIKQPQDEDPDEGVRDLVELVLRKLDVDKDGKISMEDFQTIVIEEPLLLEAFGQCLPSAAAAVSFLSTLQA